MTVQYCGPKILQPLMKKVGADWFEQRVTGIEMPEVLALDAEFNDAISRFEKLTSREIHKPTT